jgi:serine/threonine protein kinase/Tfp pilus assembly protein PilF
MSKDCPKCKSENPESATFCADCGTQFPPSVDIDVTATIEAPREELTTGSTFAGRFQIIEEIGKGGMGRVYKVQDTKVNEKIALKLIKPEIAKDKKTIERFSNELRLARKIRHKNVCQMFDLGEERGTQFITMEYVSGEDLRNSIRRFGQLPIGKSTSIVKQICEGLGEAHKQGVVHRDLKSNNIMIDDEGNVRIMDFGIARSLETKGITGAGVMIGTPEYMSPEQVEGKEIDQRSDIYSLGIILYEMVTGKLPFEGDTPFTVGVKQKSEPPQKPKDINSQIPNDLNNVILKCLEKEKENRYQSVGEILSELSNIEKGIPTTEMKISDKKPLTSREITVTVGVKKLLVPALLVIAVVITGLILWKTLPKTEATPAQTAEENPSLAVMYFENSTGDVGMDQYRKAISDLLITDLSQSKYLDVMSGAKLFNILEKMGQLEERTFSSEVIEEVANRGKVGYVIVGSYSRAGDVYRLNYSLLDAHTSDIVGSDTVEGRGQESIWTMIDEITRKIKTNLNLSEEMLADDFDLDIGKITTISPEAYNYYSEGTKYDHLDIQRKSIELMEKAIEIDPDFAMAYRSMGLSYGELRYPSKAIENLKKAFELSHRVSMRERYQIEADYYWYTGKDERAREAYIKKIELYPYDTDANINLGAIYRDMEEWEMARERFEVLRQAGDESIWSYLNLSSIYMAQQSFDKAKEVVEEYFSTFSDNATLHLTLAGNYALQDKLDLALTEVEKALILDPNDYEIHNAKCICLVYKGDIDAAEEGYKKLMLMTEKRAHYSGLLGLQRLSMLKGKLLNAQRFAEQRISWTDENGEPNLKASSHFTLAYVHSLSGEYEKTLQELDESWKIAVEADLRWSQTWNYFNRGFYYIDMGLFDKAQENLDKYKSRVNSSLYKNNIKFYNALMGKMELEKGNFSSAIEFMEKALSAIPYGSLNKFAWFHEVLAQAHYESGNIHRARDEYEKITRLTSGMLGNELVYAKSFYNLGKVCEELGETAKAIDNYEKFLELWKDADPGLPEVDDAKSRLASLISQ